MKLINLIVCCFVISTFLMSGCSEQKLSQKTSPSQSIEQVKKEPVNLGDKKGHDMTPPIAAEDIPPAPILNVSQALASMHIQSGFSLENVAAEPFVFSPVTVSFDGNGRIWVAEMTTFMPDLDGQNEEIPKGNIAILEDADKDGVVDKRTVFLDDIILPRTIAFVEGGIFYSDQTQLYFAEVLADDKLGIREVVDPTYAAGGNVEHKANGMLYGLDHWYYNANSNRRYKVLPLEADIPNRAKEIYRNHLWKVAMTLSEDRGQWGLSMDDYGRLFHNNNSSPARGEYLRPNSLNRNPDFIQKTKAFAIGSKQVFPNRMNPGVNRGYLPDVLVSEEGEDRGKLINFTAASGNQVYRGDQFPKKYYGVSFTPEPAANLITVRKIIEQQGRFSGEAIFPQAEILASTDERFRPVNLHTAPDGSLYIVDMYHGVIQHKKFLTTYLRKQAEDRGLQHHNSTMGRIYRLRWKERALGEQPQLRGQTVNHLVPLLAHDNGWWRDTARRMLVQKGDTQVIPAILTLFATTTDHRAKINILWTLEGLEGLNLDIVRDGLADQHPKVQISAIELMSRLAPAEQQQLSSQLMTLAQSEYEVALQVALTAGGPNTENALQLINLVLQKYADKPFIYEVLISGIGDRMDELEQILEANPKAELQALKGVLLEQQKNVNNFKNLTHSQKEQFKRGKALYEGKATCFGCHGMEGQGIHEVAPPLKNSEWVTDQPERLIKVLLHGLMGPIEVAGEEYNLPMVMPGFAANANMSDQDYADIATYLRNSWGNIASAIDAETVAELRKQTASRKTPYQASEFAN